MSEKLLSTEEAVPLLRVTPAGVMQVCFRALCRYDVREFDGEVVFQAMRAHPDLYSLHLGRFLS